MPRTQLLRTQLRRLHMRASSPSIRDIAAACKIGCGTVHRLLNESTLPKPDHLLPVVEYLAKKCYYRPEPDRACDYFDWLWRRAQGEWIPDPFPPSDDDEGPEPPYGLGPLPGGPTPRPTKPKGPSGAPGNPEPGRDRDEHSAIDTPGQESSVIVTNPGGSRALIIGVDRYTDPGVSQMRERDLRSLSEVRDLMAVSFRGGAELIRNPSRNTIWQALTEMAVTTEDTLFVYFAGHGLTDDRTSDTYLCAADTSLSSEGMLDNVLNLRDVRYLLAQSNARNRVLVLDCCFSESLTTIEALQIVATRPADGLNRFPQHMLWDVSLRPTYVVGHRAEVESRMDGFLEAFVSHARGALNTSTTSTIGSFFDRLVEALPEDVRRSVHCRAVSNGANVAWPSASLAVSSRIERTANIHDSARWLWLPPSGETSAGHNLYALFRGRRPELLPKTQAMNMTSRTQISEMLRGVGLPDDEDQARDLLRALGAAGVEVDRGLRRYRAARAAQVQEERADRWLRFSYVQQVGDTAPLAQLVRPDQLAQLGAWYPGGDEAYVWWQAGPRAGASSLMSWFEPHAPPGVWMVSFFVTARYTGRANATAFTDELIDQLAAITGPSNGLRVAFTEADVGSERRAIVEVIWHATMPYWIADVAILELAEPAPPAARPTPSRTPARKDLIGEPWWEFGFPKQDPLGSATAGTVGVSLAGGWVRLDTDSRYLVEPGFSGGGLWSAEYQAVVGPVGQAQQGSANAGDGRTLTVHQITQLLPEQRLGELARWILVSSGEAALAASGWTLAADPEARRHWRPRARGASVDSEAGFRFQGRLSALTEIVAWLQRPVLDRKVLVITGLPGVGKSAVLGRIVTTADPEIRASLPPEDDAVRAPVGSIRCAVHAKGKTALDVAQEIARAASAGIPEQMEDLIPAVRNALTDKLGASERFTIVIDALDEAFSADDARVIVAAVVLPLVETCATVGAQVIVGSRRRDGRGDLLAGFAGAATVVDLDEPEYFAPEDVYEYALVTLRLTGDERPGNPYADLDHAAPLARRIAEFADRNFLVAGLVARAYGLHDIAPADPYAVSFAPTVSDALSRYVERIPPVGAERYRRWSGRLVGYAMVYTGGDGDAAEGLVDEAFHLLFEHWKNLAGYDDASLYGWLRMVVRNRAVDEYRRGHRSRIVVVDPLEDGERLDRPSDEDDPGHPVHELLAREHRELARDLATRCMAVIHGMRSERRIAVLLRGEGLTSAEIGTRMGIAASTVRGYWREAIMVLKATVGDVITMLDTDTDVAERDWDGEGRHDQHG